LLPLNRRSSTGASRVPLVAGHTHTGDGNQKIFFVQNFVFLSLSSIQCRQLISIV
jgi:hypothetical protein